MKKYILEGFDQSCIWIFVSGAHFPLQIQECWTLDDFLAVVMGVLVDQDRVLMSTLPFLASARIEDPHFPGFGESVELALDVD